jgi:hypothetical protein
LKNILLVVNKLIQIKVKEKKYSNFGIILLCSIFHFSVSAQDQLLEKGLKKIDSTISTFENQQKKTWLNLLPNLNYDLQNQSFNVGVSLNSFANFYQQKQRNKIELAKYKHSLLEKLDRNLESIELKNEDFKIDFLIAKNKIELFEIDFDLFQISSGKYENNEISSEDFLRFKQSYLSKKNSLKTAVLRLQLKAKRISLKTKNNTLEDSIGVLSELILKYE